MKKHNSKNNARRGFSIVEVVIAMTVITIVCFATLSIILSANISGARAVKRQQAQLYAEDVVNCFRVASDEESLKSSIAAALSVEQIDDSTITLDGGYTLEYSVVNGNKITVTVTEDGDKVIAEVEYTKR